MQGGHAEAAADGGDQVRGEVGLLEKELRGAVAEIGGGGLDAVAAGEDDAQLRLLREAAHREFAAAEPVGHHHIRAEQRDPFAVEIEELLRARAVRRLDDGEAAAFERGARDLADGRLVFHEQDGHTIGGWKKDALARRCTALGGRCGRCAGGQVDFKHRAFAEFAGDFDPAAMLLHDAMHGGEAEAGALALLLRGEEGLEDALQLLGGNAAATVADAQADRGAGPGIGLLRDIRRADLHQPGAERQRPALGHRIAGVHREIRDDLIEHGGIGLHCGERRRQLAVQRDVLAERAGEQRHRAFHHGIEIDRTREHRPLAAEAQELPREIRRAIRRGGHAVDVGHGLRWQIVA